MTEILGVGVATLDIINFTETYPGPDDEVRATAQQQRRGGNLANTLSVLSQFHHRCRWLGSLGDDASADFIRNDLNTQGIVVEQAGRMQGKTPTSYITVAKDSGSRSIVHYRQLAELGFEQFRQVDLTGVDYCHFEGRNPQETAKMIGYLQKHHPQLRYSVEFEKPRPHLHLLQQGAEIIFFSRHYAEAMGYTNANDFLRQFPAQNPHAWLIVTWGAQGCFYRRGDNPEVIVPVAPASQIQVIDSVGAGDTFIAGFLHTWWHSRDVHRSAEFANALAAKKCAQIGFQGLVT